MVIHDKKKVTVDVVTLGCCVGSTFVGVETLDVSSRYPFSTITVLTQKTLFQYYLYS
jgi:hypothetical protein